jgi:hypothetical protein
VLRRSKSECVNRNVIQLGLGNDRRISAIDDRQLGQNSVAFTHKAWVGPVFWFALLSAVVGVGIQVFSVWVQIALQVENRVVSLALDGLRHPENYNIKRGLDWDSRFAREIIIPARDEFIESRPGPFRELAFYAKEKAENDPTFLAKNAASCTQMMLPFLALQYLLLGVAVFWPMGVLLWK